MVCVSSAGAYVCYLLVSTTSSRRTYVGVTNNLERRLKQHNGILAGGAKATRSASPWCYYVTVHGFPNNISALQFEYMWKHMAPKKSTGETSRIRKLVGLLQKEKWTTKAEVASKMPLEIQIHQKDRLSLLELTDNVDQLPEYITIVDNIK